MHHSIEHYANFTSYQLATSPYFMEWVRFPDPVNTVFWNSFLAAYPQKSATLNEAVALVQSMYVIRYKPTPLQQRNMWDEIYNNIGNNKIYVRKSPWIYIARAAVIVGIIAAGAWFLRNKDNGETTIASTFGEVKALYLPDSTQVTLNGNSTIRYSKNWKEREVWIEGEAYFNVKKLPGQHFDVHSNGVDIHVLGTSFNIRNRRGITAVVLNTGKLMVAAAANKENKVILSAPGDMARYDSKHKDLVHKHIALAKVTGWQQHKLQLDMTTVADFFEELEDDWGYKIQLSDTTLLKKKISGEIDMTDKQVLMDALAVILNAKVTQQGSTIIVTPN